MTESKSRSVKILSKNSTPDKAQTGQQQETLELDGLNLLNIRNQKKVIHEYNLKKPQPTIESLASKYEVSCKHISDILRDQKSILKSDRTLDEESRHSSVLSQRQEQINFLDLVMYEYLQRALYHNIPVDDVTLQHKAADVVDCMAITKFKPSYSWLMNFKRKYGIKNLLQEIKPKQVKRSSLEPVDMVLFVQQRKNLIIKQQKYRECSSISQPKKTSDKNVHKSTPKLRKKTTPKIVYKPTANEDETDSLDVNAEEATIKIEISPTQISEYTGLQPVPLKTYSKVSAVVATNKNQTAKSNDKLIPTKMQESLQISGLHDINQESSPLSPETVEDDDDDEFLTIYEIVDEENTPSPVDAIDVCSSPPLTKTENEFGKPDLGQHSANDITIKTELLTNDDDPMLEMRSSTILTHNLPENVIIKTEPSYPSTQLDEDIKPALNSEVLATNGQDGYQPSNSNTTSMSPNVLDEDIKPTIIVKNANGTDDQHHHQQSSSFANCKRRWSYSPLPDIDTLEEAMKHLKVLENYVMLKENFRAIGLISQLEDAIKKSPPQQ